jgi:hypothetical protein
VKERAPAPRRSRPRLCDRPTTSDGHWGKPVNSCRQTLVGADEIGKFKAD